MYVKYLKVKTFLENQGVIFFKIPNNISPKLMHNPTHQRDSGQAR